MSKPVLYAFINDDAMRLTGRLATLSSEDQGYGILTGESANFFIDRGILNDIRKGRLIVLNNRQPFGRMTLWFDLLRMDNDILKNMTDVDTVLFFNILERIVYQQQYSDANIEHMLRNAASFAGYVPDSMMHGVNSGLAQVEDVSNETLEVPFFDWVSFDFETDNVSFKVHAWISNHSFKKEYPYTTITSVIPPYDPKVLANPIALIGSGNMNVLTSGSSFIFNNINLETVARDQNGVYTYMTKYRLDNTRNLQLPFALPYCGPKVPSSLECRRAIRLYLEDTTGLKPDDLEALFPELYVESRFYIVPLWDMYTQLTDREVYPSIISYLQLRRHANHIFFDREPAFVDEYMEILLNAQNKMFSLSLPDDSNTNLMSILQQHPTYQDYATHNAAGFRFMATATQDFAGKLSRCFSILNGEELLPEFIRTQVNTSWYLSFTSGKAEYLVMEKLSYKDLISTLDPSTI